MKKTFSLGIVAVLFVAVMTLPTPATAESETSETNYRLIFYDGHMHTIFSDGNGTVSDIVATAIRRGLDAVIITDHSEDLTLDEWNWLVGNCSFYTNSTFLCLPAFEMTGNESIFMRDHVLAYNVSNPFVTDELTPTEVWPSPFNPDGTGPLSHENITKWIEFAHSRGGITVHAHPTGHTKMMYNVDCIEIWNQNFIDEINALGEALPPEIGGPYHGAGYTLNNLAIYGEKNLTASLRNAIYIATLFEFGVGIWIGSPEDPLDSWDSFLLNHTKGQEYVPFAVGGTDTHNSGAPNSKVGLAKTGVYVENFTANDLYKGIKEGRSFVTTGPIISSNISDIMVGGTSFDVSDVIMGGELSLPYNAFPILNIKVESSAPSANITQVEIMKNGVSWQTFNPNQSNFEAQIKDISAPTNSYYRIEVTEYDPVLNETRFAYSNPIFVRVEPAVGGVYIPANKLSLLAPYIGLTILLAVAVMTVAYVKKRKKHTEIIS